MQGIRSFMMDKAFLTVSSVVYLPRLNRTAPLPFSSGTFMADKIGDNDVLPVWHAEPVVAAISGNR
jgi:hypothetical protein